MSQRIPARSAVEIVRKECIDRRVQLGKALVLIHLRSAMAQFHARSAQAKGKPRGCKPEKGSEGLLLQVCAESKEIQHLKCLKVTTRSARKSLFQDSGLLESLERIGISRLLKGSTKELCLGSLQKRRKFT